MIEAIVWHRAAAFAPERVECHERPRAVGEVEDGVHHEAVWIIKATDGRVFRYPYSTFTVVTIEHPE